MKNSILIVLVGFISFSMNAQKVIEKTFDYNNQYIDLDVNFASSIEVKTWDKSQVYFKAHIYNFRSRRGFQGISQGLSSKESR